MLIRVILCIDTLLWFVSQAETRAEFAERSVAKLEKTIDDLEGIQHSPVVFASTFTDTNNMSTHCHTVNNPNSFTNPTSAVGTQLMTGSTVLCPAVLTDGAITSNSITGYLVNFICLFMQSESPL